MFSNVKSFALAKAANMHSFQDLLTHVVSDVGVNACGISTELHCQSCLHCGVLCAVW